ncbi:MAG TPA: MFS transporter, partial [Acidimicrobiales bacterium]
AGAAPSVAWLALATAAVGASVAGQATGVVGDLGDRYPEGARARVLAVYALAVPAGAAGAAALAVVAAATGSWRWAMVVSLAGVPVGVAVWRQARRAPVAGDRAQGLGPTAQRLRRLRSLPGLAAAGSALGLLLIGVPLVAGTYLQHHWRQQLGGRAALVLIAALGAVVGAPLAGWWGDRAAGHGEDRAPMVVAGALAVVGGGLLAAAYLPVLGLVEVAWVLTVAAAAVAGVATAQWAMAVVPAADRSTALGILAGYGLVGGGLVGTVVLTAFSHADGSRLALALAAVAFVAAGLGAWLARDGAWSDAAAIAAEGADSTPAGGRPHGAARPALVVRGVDFSYGARQVLFGVDMRVGDGEAAALLGTNGAGKSTLLRLVAGLDHPSAGSIRIWGRDSTYLEAEQVVGLGVGLLPGGRMSFPGLTVMENLRVGGHTLRRQGARLQAAIDEVMGLFPVLAERRDQRVGTLSGGEQQMLALARVLLTRPRLLVIDELSLGLAPKAVESLLAVVRRLNQDGTTVLLVEQSVNLALSLAAHALFLERGEVRFDGRTADLLARDDLLRPVFLGAGR